MAFARLASCEPALHPQSTYERLLHLPIDQQTSLKLRLVHLLPRHRICVPVLLKLLSLELFVRALPLEVHNQRNQALRIILNEDPTQSISFKQALLATITLQNRSSILPLSADSLSNNEYMTLQEHSTDTQRLRVLATYGTVRSLGFDAPGKYAPAKQADLDCRQSWRNGLVAGVLKGECRPVWPGREKQSIFCLMWVSVVPFHLEILQMIRRPPSARWLANGKFEKLLQEHCAGGLLPLLRLQSHNGRGDEHKLPALSAHPTASRLHGRRRR